MRATTHERCIAEFGREYTIVNFDANGNKVYNSKFCQTNRALTLPSCCTSSMSGGTLKPSAMHYNGPLHGAFESITPQTARVCVQIRLDSSQPCRRLQRSMPSIASCSTLASYSTVSYTVIYATFSHAISSVGIFWLNVACTRSCLHIFREMHIIFHPYFTCI